MTFKSTLCKLWLKQIRMRFARFYECYDCEKRYRLTDKRDECPHCETKAICLWDEQGAESERIDCESDIKNNGECTSCGYRNPPLLSTDCFECFIQACKVVHARPF